MGIGYQATHLRRKEAYPLYEGHLEIGNYGGAIALGITFAATSAWVSHKYGGPVPISVVLGLTWGMFGACAGVSIGSSIVQGCYYLKEKFSTQGTESKNLASLVNAALPQSRQNPSSQ